MSTFILISILGYLLGSIPFGLVLVRVFRHQDIRTIGSGNIGATNVFRSGSKGLGALTFILDGLKGYAAVYLADALMHGSAHGIPALQNAAALAGLFAILGHVFPVWLGFRGGKGVATAFGVFLAISPLSALIAFAVFGLVFAVSRFVSLSSLTSAVVFPICALVVFGARTTGIQRTLLSQAVIVFVPLLVIVKHHQNIARLAQGTEHRFGSPKPLVPGKASEHAS
jgi:glycerol-3-phosphate acyltransferase PlsY